MIDDTVFRALAHRQRRQLLVRLRTQDTRRIRKLSRESRELLVATDSFIDGYLASSMEVGAVDKALIRLHHVHLPKLAEDGFIEWDRDANLVRKGPQFESLRPILDVIEADRTDELDRERLIVR